MGEGSHDFGEVNHTVDGSLMVDEKNQSYIKHLHEAPSWGWEGSIEERGGGMGGGRKVRDMGRDG